MRVLWLALESSKDYLGVFTERLSGLCELTELWLTPKNAKNVAKAVGGKEIKQYDRVLLYLPIQKLIKQSPYIRCIPNLVLLQRDLTVAITNKSSDLPKFAKLLTQMPWVRVLAPVGEAQQFLARKKVDHANVPIGYNSARFIDQNQEPIYFAAIVADVEKPPIKSRKNLLFEIKTHNKLQMLEPQVGDDLVKQLNQIGIVVCSDEGCASYRALAFEAMACGAVVMAWDRGEAENKALGFEDMKNVVLYHDEKSASAKLNFLKRHPEQLEAIREQGKQLAHSHHNDRALAERVATLLEKPLAPFKGDDIEDALKFRFFR